MCQTNRVRSCGKAEICGISPIGWFVTVPQQLGRVHRPGSVRGWGRSRSYANPPPLNITIKWHMVNTWCKNIKHVFFHTSEKVFVQTTTNLNKFDEFDVV